MNPKEQVNKIFNDLVNEYKQIKISISDRNKCIQTILRKMETMCETCLNHLKPFVNNGECDRCNISKKICQIDDIKSISFVNEQKDRMEKKILNKPTKLIQWIRENLLKLISIKIKKEILDRDYSVLSNSDNEESDNEKDKDYKESDSEDEEYEVEKILEYRDDGSYKIKWEGYPETTWEPEEKLTNCEELLNEFWGI